MEESLKNIKIGRQVYEIMDGDYILFNGSSHQFCSNRILYRKGFDSYTSVTIPESVLKKIPLDKMKKVEYENYGMKLTKWCF